MPDTVAPPRSPADVLRDLLGLGPITTEFNAPSAFSGLPHPGIDIGAPIGTSVSLPVGGTVSRIWTDGTGGRQVSVTDALGFTQIFAHLSSITTTVGSFLSPGDVVGASGSSGHVTGPHIHYEVRTPSGNALDPRRYVSEFGGPPTDPNAPSVDKVKEIADYIGKLVADAFSPSVAGAPGYGADLDVLGKGQEAGPIIAAKLRAKYPDVPLPVLRAIVAGQGKDAQSIIDSIPVVGGASKAGVIPWADEFAKLLGHLDDPHTWAKIGLTLGAVALLGTGVMLYARNMSPVKL